MISALLALKMAVPRLARYLAKSLLLMAIMKDKVEQLNKIRVAATALDIDKDMDEEASA